MPLARRVPDGPWYRLVWSLPAAVALMGLALAGFLGILTTMPPLPTSRPVAMRIVELPPEPAPADAPPAITTTPPPPKEEPPPPSEAAPVTETAPLPPVPQQKPPQPRPAIRREALPQPQPRRSMPPEAPTPSAAPTSPPVTRGPTEGITMGARALYKPMPEIPEELRHRQLTLVAVASFRVAADGSATVALLQTTPDPRLNEALISALRKWRFFPAMENGRPVASTIEIRIPIEVR